MSKALVKRLTCCGLQKEQGEETADQDCTLHDGCQENSDCHTGYIYRGRKVKGHEERGGGAQRGPAGGGAGVSGLHVLQESGHAPGTPGVQQLVLPGNAGHLQVGKTWMSGTILSACHCFMKKCFKKIPRAVPQ